MDIQDRLLRIVGEIYGTVGRPERWSMCLESIRGLLQGTAANLLFHDHRDHHGGIFASTISPEVNEAYARYFHAVDPWALSVSPGTFVPEQILLGHTLVPHHSMIRTEFYTDFGKRFGLTRSIVGVIEHSATQLSGVSINRSDASGEFDDESVRILSVLLPHVRRALALHRQLTTVGAERCALTDVLGHVRAAVVLLDPEGCVVLMNRAAATLDSRCDGFAVEKRHVVGATARATAALQLAVSSTIAAARGHTLSASSGRAYLPRPSGRRPLDVLVVPLEPGAHGVTVAALFITDPDERPVFSDHVLADRFGLTPVESRVANGLAHGHSVREIAEACRLSTQTTRWYVKQVLAKTGTSRQAEVVRLLLSLTAASVHTEER